MEYPNLKEIDGFGFIKYKNMFIATFMKNPNILRALDHSYGIWEQQ